MRGDSETHQRDDRIALARRRDADTGQEDARDRAARQHGSAGGARANSWPEGLVVSLKASGAIVGRVIAVTRQADGVRFTRVRVTASDNRQGFRIGDSDWHNGLWVPGAGERLLVCEGCRQYYRGVTARADQCPLCDDRPVPVAVGVAPMTDPPTRRPWDIETPFDVSDPRRI